MSASNPKLNPIRQKMWWKFNLKKLETHFTLQTCNKTGIAPKRSDMDPLHFEFQTEVKFMV